MQARTILCGLMLLPLLCATAVSARAQSTSPQQTLNQYVADLQKIPNDTALREKIIALALITNPPPEVPAEATELLEFTVTTRSKTITVV
jgi:hypothetical protein